MRKFYIFAALLLIGTYGWAGFTGREFGRSRRGIAQQSVRGARTGTTIFWYRGYHGGK